MRTQYTKIHSVVVTGSVAVGATAAASGATHPHVAAACAYPVRGSTSRVIRTALQASAMRPNTCAADMRARHECTLLQTLLTVATVTAARKPNSGKPHAFEYGQNNRLAPRSIASAARAHIVHGGSDCLEALAGPEAIVFVIRVGEFGTIIRGPSGVEAVRRS